jgi:hypothetical protein
VVLRGYAMHSVSKLGHGDLGMGAICRATLKAMLNPPKNSNATRTRGEVTFVMKTCTPNR